MTAVAMGLFRLVLCAAGLAAFAGVVRGADWPGYMADGARSGVSGETISFPLAPAWEYEPAREPAPAWPEPGREINRMDFDAAFQPVVAGGLVLFGSSADDTVRALREGTGEEVWAFTAGGPVRFAPQVSDGRCFFASDDGVVYALEAASGRLIWRFKASAKPDRMIGNGRLISSWPCRSGVLVDGGTVYATAGMWPAMGVYVFALDAATGRTLWFNDTIHADFVSQPHGGAYGMAGLPPQGYLLLAGEMLVVTAGRSVPAGFDRRTGAIEHYRQGANQHAGGTWSLVAGGYYFQNATVRGPDGPPWTGEYRPGKDDTLVGYVATSGVEVIRVPGCYRLLVKGRTAYAARPGKIEAYSWNFPPSGSATTLSGLGEPQWSVAHPRVYAMAGARNALVVGGKGTVAAFDDAGQVIWSGEAEGQVRGLAVANGALVVSTREGRLTRFVPGSANSGKRTVSGRRARSVPKPRAEGPAVRVAGLAAEAGMTRGYALVLGMEDAAFAADLSERTDLQCVAVLADEAKADAERKRLRDSAGGYGTKVVVEAVGPDRPAGFPPYIANVVVVGAASRIAPAEAYRALRPCGGLLCFADGNADAAGAWIERAGVPASEVRRADGVVTVVRGRLPGAFDWDSGKEPDKRVKWPLTMLWFGEPGPSPFTSRHLRVGPPIVANGRAFFRGYHRLMAADAYNGTELWSREIPDLYPGWEAGSAQVAADDRSVYLTFGREGFDVAALLAGSGLESVEWPCTWQVFGPLPKTIEPLAPGVLKTIPAALEVNGVGLPGRPVQSTGEWLDLGRQFGKFGPNRSAYAMGRIVCRKAGRLVVNASADWWMEWYLDGELLYSTLASGNEGSARSLAAHTFSRDVSRGEHTVAVFVRAGSLGWTLKSLGGLMPPDSTAVRNSICVRLDAATGEEAGIYGDARVPERFDLATPQTVSFVAGTNQTGQVTAVREGNDIEFRLAADTLSAADRHVWELYLDFRPVVRRQGLYGRGAFGVRVVTAGEEASGELTQHIAGPSAPKPEAKVLMLTTNAVVLPPPSSQAPERSLLDVLDETGELRDLPSRRAAASTVAAPEVAVQRGRSEVVVRFRGDDLRAFLRGEMPKSFGFAARLLVGCGRDRTGWLSGGVFGPSKVTTASWATFVLDPSETAEAELKARREGLIGLEQVPAHAWKSQAMPVRPRSWKTEQRHPLTGENIVLGATDAGRAYTRFYGCGGVSCSEMTDFFRSATVACHDYADDSGVRNFSGTRPGCGISMLPALGILLSPPGSAGCRCGYSFQCSFAMAPAAERGNEDWAIYWADPADSIETASLNLGAPGDRRDGSRRLWLAFPRPAVDAVRAGVFVPGSVTGMKPFRFNADRIVVAGTDCPWVYSCGLAGEGRVVIGLNQPQNPPVPAPGAAGVKPVAPDPVKYTVALHFAEPDDAKPGERVFDVLLQGKVVLKDFDVAKEAGAARKAVVKRLHDIEVSGQLDVSLVAVKGRPPIINGLELASETSVKVDTALALRGTRGDDAAATELVRLARERSVALRNRALRSLAEFAAAREDVLSLVPAALCDPDGRLAHAALAVLQQAGTNAVPHLLVPASVTNAAVRRRAAEIAVGLGDAGNAGFRLLCSMAAEDDPVVRTQSLRAMTVYGESRPFDVLAVLDRAVGDRDRAVRETAQRGLVGLYRSGLEFKAQPATVATILRMLKTGPPDMAESIGEALVRAGPSVVPALVQMARDADPQVRLRAVRALGQMGPVADSAVPEMLRDAKRLGDPLFTAAVSNAVIEIRGVSVTQ